MRRGPLLLVCMIALFSGVVQAQIPHQMTIQGILKDSTGAPIVNDSVLTRFIIYDSAAGGNALWLEGLPVATDAEGLFSLVLGTVDPIPDSIFADSARWLAIKVGTDPEMTPRQPLVSSPYSFVAGGGSGGGAFLPLAGGTMTGAILSTGDPEIVMGKGNFGFANSNSGLFALVAGMNDTASGDYSVVGGGVTNTAAGTAAVVGGGRRNAALGDYAVVGGGGGLNPTDSNVAAGWQSVVGGGTGNRADSSAATVAGGRLNSAAHLFATVAGGFQNHAEENAAFVGGGQSNSADGPLSAVGGGLNNLAGGYAATIGGGSGNQTTTQATFVGGGQTNLAFGIGSTVAGGLSNSAGGPYSSVPGGRDNAAGGAYSFAAGRRAKIGHPGTFVWADSTDADFASTSANQFLVRASGGVGIGTDTPVNALDVEGGVAIGNAYSGNQTAPFSGLIVQGLAGFGVSNPHSKLHVGGAIATAAQKFVASATLNEYNSVAFANASSGPITITLPDANGIAGRQYIVKKVDATGNKVTVATTAAQTIDGASSYDLLSPWRYVAVVSDGINWMIISN